MTSVLHACQICVRVANRTLIPSPGFDPDAHRRPCRDDVDHPGESVAWGQWAITSNDPDFRGRGATDSGEDYGPAPGATFILKCLACWRKSLFIHALAAPLRPPTPAVLA